MNGIDISSWQAGLAPEAVEADFIIIKATEGVSYQNPHWRDWAERTLASGKRLGFYHYADGGDVYAEANHFIDTVADYIGHAILVLDWEEGGNDRYFAHGQWTKPWLDYVAERTGSTPLIYVSRSIMGLHDFGYPMWIAQYPGYEQTGYQEHPWNEGAYECAIRQYSSTGRIAGYDGNLDINKAYITPGEWDELMGGFDMASAQEIIDILNDTSDPTGREIHLTMREHLKWMAKAQEMQSQQIMDMQRKLDTIIAKLS